MLPLRPNGYDTDGSAIYVRTAIAATVDNRYKLINCYPIYLLSAIAATVDNRYKLFCDISNGYGSDSRQQL